MKAWEKFQNNFTKATGFTVIIVDKDGKPLLNDLNFSNYSLLIKPNIIGYISCLPLVEVLFFKTIQNQLFINTIKV